MRDVVWSDDALRDFDEAIFHIAQDSERGASLVADRIEVTSDQSAEMPTGHADRVTGTYKKRVLRTAYILA